MWWANKHGIAATSLGPLEARFCNDVQMWPSYANPESVIYVPQLDRRIVVTTVNLTGVSPNCPDTIILHGRFHRCERAATAHTHHYSSFVEGEYKIRVDWYKKGGVQ